MLLIEAFNNLISKMQGEKTKFDGWVDHLGHKERDTVIHVTVMLVLNFYRRCMVLIIRHTRDCDIGLAPQRKRHCLRHLEFLNYSPHWISFFLSQTHKEKRGVMARFGDGANVGANGLVEGARFGGGALIGVDSAVKGALFGGVAVGA
ncbi:hypothetical protein L1987_66031 [Smallanthus sonchifolius]|uniref:Uncharacterized protein n=1 Tax=Smallanthus sonchifolius TaxID=185202 RepID=A0ACB9BWD4_9ASTR|nr:hypothetical protein L1987_66031 [Smallanthus sonchifolius]